MSASFAARASRLRGVHGIRILAIDAEAGDFHLNFPSCSSHYLRLFLGHRAVGMLPRTLISGLTLF